jgi:hypothetical protein
MLCRSLKSLVLKFLIYQMTLEVKLDKSSIRNPLAVLSHMGRKEIEKEL